MLTTIGTYLNYLAPDIGKRRRVPRWPPDVFALVAALLDESGAYISVTSKWPPGRVGKNTVKKLSDWVELIRNIGTLWRVASVKDAVPPQEIQSWWDTVRAANTTPLQEVKENRELCDALLQLCASADEASRGAGLPPVADEFEVEAFLLLSRNSVGGSTLCKELETAPLRVLPKLHTAQSGLTLNCLSHHLALCRSGDIEPHWYWAPSQRLERHCLNLLILPWPEIVRPSEFHEVKKSDVDMPSQFHFFTYEPMRGSTDVPARVAQILKRAERLVGEIDGVIFPELSLTLEEYEEVAPRILKQGAFVVCGVISQGRGNRPGRNVVRFDVPMSPKHAVSYQQDKHHRWKLDKAQIIQYGLGSSLNPEWHWWEHIEIGTRQLMFVAMRSWLTVSVLICEDLARQHPVAELVRSVGPNLVLSVLMDGPQLAARWPARYATVLADDPGCSVLTLSSLGMVQLCRPLDSPATSRNIALWKDAKSGRPIEIEIPAGAGGVVLNLAIQRLQEWAADGRGDDSSTGYPILAGVHPVFER